MPRDATDAPGPPPPAPADGWWEEIRAALAGRVRDYTSGSLGRAIFLLAVPMVLEMSMQSVFAVVDIFFVGKLGPEAVAVVGLSDSLLTIVFSIALGLSIATTAMVARRVGEGEIEKAGQAAVQSLYLGTAFSVLFGVAGWWWAADLLRLMGAGETMVRDGASFTAILLGGNITVMMLFLINAIFRGAGDAAVAMRALWIANLVNIALDPLLIFGWWIFPELGLAGAAVATTLGRGVGVVYQLRRLLGTGTTISLAGASRAVRLPVLRRLLRVSAVGMLQFLIGTASWLVVIRFLALFGGVAVAGYTIAVRVIIFVLLPSWGMGNAAATLVGQNLGAAKPARAARAVWLTGFVNMVFLSAVAVLFVLLAEPLAALFTDDRAVIAQAARCLKIVSFSYPFLAFGMVTVQAFNGAGDTATPTWINFLAYWALELPLAYALAVPAGWGPQGVYVAICIAQVALAALGVHMFRRGRWKTQRI